MVRLEVIRVPPGDREKFKALAQSIWLPTFRSYFKPDELLALFEGMYGDRALDSIFASTQYELFFLHGTELDGSPFGYLGIEWGSHTLKLDKIYIHPDLQGRGLGSRVLDLVEGWANSKRYKTIELRVNVANLSAIAFYEHHGFSVTRTERFPGPDGYVYHDRWMTKRVGF